MSRFNPNLDKSPTEWGALALRENLSDRSGHLVVAGIVGGSLLASATTPILGGVLAAYCVIKGIQCAIAADKNKKLIKDFGCVAHVLNSSNFRAYRRQVGDEKILEELRYADEEGLPLTIDAVEFLEELSTKVPVASLPPGRIQDKKSAIDYYDPTATAKIDIIKEMSHRVANTILIGIPGSGKGMLVSNAIRAIKRKHPDLKVFVIDPKADRKEVGYFNCCDEVKAFACMDAKPETVAAWAEAAFDEYAKYAQANNETLLIVDEGTMLGNKLSQAKSTLLVDKLTSYTSGGDSVGRNVWFMMQSPYVGSASLNLSTSSQMTTIVIAFSENLGTLVQWKSAKIFKHLSLDTVSELIDNSTTGRAIYYGKTGQWYLMPELTNYSGYNRDQRIYLPGFEPPNPEKTNTDVNVIARLEELFHNTDESQDKADSGTKSGLSPESKLLLSYFDNVKQKTAKSIQDLKDANKLRPLDSRRLLEALKELVVTGHLTFDAEGRYLKPDWD